MDPHWPDIHYYSHQQQQQNKQPPSVNYPPHFPQQQPHVIASGGSDLLQQQIRHFWQNQQQESDQAVDLRNHSLPLARIKKIMKSDEDVRMISAEAPVLLSKACEMFIQDLTMRSWICTEESKRRTLQKGDISAGLSTSDLFDFLVDIVPREKPIVTKPPVMPFMISLLENENQYDYNLGESSGSTSGLPMQLVQNDQMDRGYNKRDYVHGT